MIAIQIDDHDLPSKLATLSSKVRHPANIMRGVGREAANVLKRHFRQKDRRNPNRLSPRREHFWLQVMRSVQAPVLNASGNQVTVSITHPAIAHKVTGGTIRAKRVRNLTIPVDPEAYGRAPRVFEQETGLELIFIKQRDKALLATRAEGSDNLQVRYLLTPSVTQAPDPTALPAKTVIEDAVTRRAERMVEREIYREGLV